MANNQHSLRQAYRQARRTLSASQQTEHAKQATQLFIESDFLTNAQHIAIFLSQDGELATQLLIEHLWQNNRQVYLPIILNNGELGFALYDAKTKLTPNKFNILEPSKPQYIEPKQLDLIIMPLTCFDTAGNRIGMGGGYYDKTLSFKNKQPTKISPLLVGWAHQCQKTDQIKTHDWDIPLNAVITEVNLYRFNP